MIIRVDFLDIVIFVEIIIFEYGIDVGDVIN